MNIILPLKDEAGAVSNETLGFQPLNNAWGMSGLADRLGNPTDDANAVLPNAGETAIPDVCAHVQYLRTKLGAEHLDMKDEAVKAWMGVLAMIALSERKSNHFKLSVQTVDLTAGANDYLKGVYCDALQAEHLLDANNNIRVLCQNRNPVAVLDPLGAPTGKRCFCYPFSTIENLQGEMNAVEWFVSGGFDQTTMKPIAHRWQNVCDNNQRTGLPYLNEGDKVVFAEFLCALKAQLGYGNHISFVDYPSAVNAVLNALGTDVVDQAGNLVTVEQTMQSAVDQAGNLVTVEQTMQSAYVVRPQNLLAWRGVLACVALSKLRGYKIELEEYKPRTRQSADDLVRYVLTRHEGVDSFTLIKVNGARIGRVDKGLLIRPFYYQQDPLPLVPWFDDNTHRWIDLADDAAVPEANVSLAEGKRLTSWYADLAQKPDMPRAVADELKNSADHLDRFGAGVGGAANPVLALTRGSFPHGAPISATVMGTLAKFSSVPDLAVPLPADTEIFTERLVLTMEQAFNAQSVLGIPRTNIDNTVKLICDSIKGIRKRFTALMPLKAGFTQLLSNHADQLKLMSISMQQNGCNEPIVVSMVLNDGGMTLNKQWSYSFLKGEVLYYDTFPYLAMWPYINTDVWKKYQVVLYDTPYLVKSTFLPSCGAELKPMHPAEDCGTRDGSQQWKTMEYDHFPEYIHFVLNEAGSTIEVGSVYVAPPRSKTIGGRFCYAIIDFGSSNTIVRLADSEGKRISGVGGANDYKVFTNNYVKPLTRFDADDAIYKTNFYDPIRDFHEFYWLYYRGMTDSGAGLWVADPNECTDRLPTVAEVYQDADSTHYEAPRYGQFLRSNCSVMNKFMADAANKGYTSIDALGIQSNLKMGSMTASSANSIAGKITMQMILLECALAAIEKNARLVIALSYPDDRMWGSLRPYWTEAIRTAQTTCTSIGTGILRTTELWSAKYYARRVIGDVIPDIGYCIVDIGGGTTDVSLWKSNSFGTPESLQGDMSVKYAGRQILSETLFSFYRRLRGANPPNVENFDQLWPNDVLIAATPADLVKKDYLKEMKKGFERYCAMNLGEASNLEVVRNGVPLLSDIIVSGCGFSAAVTAGGIPAVQPFLALLRLKVLNVFYVVARFLKLTKAYDKDSPDTAYYFSLAGNGAAALDICNINDVITAMMEKLVFNRSYTVVNNTERKTEVVNGLCKLINTVHGQQADVTGEDLKQPAGAADIPYRKQIPSAVLAKLPEEQRTYTGWRSLPQKWWDEIPKAVRYSYEKYVEEILNPEKGIVPDDYLSIDGGTDIYTMLTLKNPKNEALFNKYCHNIAQQVIDESGSETSFYMVHHISAIKIIDKMMLVDKYK